MIKDEDCVVYFNGLPIRVDEMGEAAVMPFLEGIVYLVRHGMVEGIDPEIDRGRLFSGLTFTLDHIPTEEEVLCHALYQNYKTAEQQYLDKRQRGEPCALEKGELDRLRMKYEVALKLTKDETSK